MYDHIGCNALILMRISMRISMRIIACDFTHASGGGIQMDRALGAKFFKFGMVVGKGMMVSKTIANKLWPISGGHLA